MGLLYGRAGRLNTKNGGFRPGQLGIAAAAENAAGGPGTPQPGGLTRATSALPQLHDTVGWATAALAGDDVTAREKQIGGSGGSLEPPGPLLEPPGPLLTHLHTVYMAYSDCLPNHSNPLAKMTCFSQVAAARRVYGAVARGEFPRWDRGDISRRR
jgi:hypothetical protein